MKHKLFLSVLMIVFSLLMSACYINKEVQSNQIGYILDDGVSISQVVGAGRYTSWAWYADLKVADGSALTVNWTDPDLVTKDKQPIGLSLVVTFRRKPDSQNASNMFNEYRSESFSNEALSNLVMSRIPEAAKAVTTRYTLDEMLGISGGTEVNVNAVGRDQVGNQIEEILRVSLGELFTDLLTVQIANIQPDATYLQKLSEKAAVLLDKEIAGTRTSTLQEQLKQQKAQTDIDLEIARRQNLVNEEMSKAYKDSKELYTLKLIEAYKGVFGESDKIVFIPQGSDLSIILSDKSNEVIPVPVQ